MKTNKLNILIFILFVFVMMFLIVAQVDYVLDGAFKEYLIPLTIVVILCYMIVFGVDLYKRLIIYKAFKKLTIISISVVNLIVFVAVITLLPTLIHYDISTNLIIAINSAAITTYAVISGFSIIVLNKYYPKN